jgi:hypothetical protein
MVRSPERIFIYIMVCPLARIFADAFGLARRRHLGFELDTLGAIALATGVTAVGVVHRWVFS